MKYNPYSVSRISSANSCLKKFKLHYIDKIKIDKPQLALYRGSFAHEILENNFDYTIKPKLNEVFTLEEASKVIEMVKKFRQTPLGIIVEKLINLKDSVREEDFAFTTKLELTDFKDNNAWFRGSADGYNVKIPQPLIWDYKTGKDKSEDENFGYDQGMIYSIYLFLKFPEIENIKVVFIFIEHGTKKDIYYHRDELNNYIRYFYKQTKEIELTEIFTSNVSALCDYCNYNGTRYCNSFKENEEKSREIMNATFSLDF